MTKVAGIQWQRMHSMVATMADCKASVRQRGQRLRRRHNNQIKEEDGGGVVGAAGGGSASVECGAAVTC